MRGAATFRSLVLLAFLGSLHLPASAAAQATGQRPMSFMDVQEMRRAGSWAVGPNARWMLYTVTTPDWEEAESQSDIHLVSLADGLPSTRRLTFTEDKNESQPTWSPDGTFFLFTSNRDSGATARGSQLYMMRIDGGEARRITDAREGVAGFGFSPDGRWLVFRAGESGLEQLHRLPVAALTTAEAEQITEEAAGIDQWEWSPDGSKIYFTRPDSFDEDEKERREKGFTVDIKNMVTPLSNLHVLDVATGDARQLTDDPSVSVDRFTVSDDGRWIGYNGGSAERYERNITGARLYSDLFLLETATGHIERLTDNHEVGEGGLSFSSDGRLIAFTAPDDLTRYTMTENRAYVREVEDRGGTFRKLGTAFDGSIGGGFWSEDGETYYFTTGVKVTTQLHALNVSDGSVRQITDERAALSVSRDEDTGVILINYSDPRTPPTLFTVDRLDHVTDRSRWVQLVDANPQVAELALGEEVEVSWTSTDGKRVGGILVYPVGYEEGQRYPLIVAIHGGPASADVLRFNGGYNAQVYAGAGYAVLKPNYRGSRNYGNAHRTDIVGDYFTLGFDDIMTGVDHLITQGIVDGNRMGALGWSAGGHWSNWILTHTDRFKAISSGAGTMNWISMYAQSDVQRNRQFYIGDDFLYENFEPYWDQSPLKYIANASTPTMIHVVEGDPRVPSPQSVELHMALKKLDVPTELFMYPGRSHGIPDPRNRLVKAVSEMAWMDYYVRGMGEKFQWQQVLETLEEGGQRSEAVSQGGGGAP
ncbi:MAG: S9 family peptidase [Gemmatimonadota bacterium]